MEDVGLLSSIEPLGERMGAAEGGRVLSEEEPITFFVRKCELKSNQIVVLDLTTLVSWCKLIVMTFHNKLMYFG